MQFTYQQSPAVLSQKIFRGWVCTRMYDQITNLIASVLVNSSFRLSKTWLNASCHPITPSMEAQHSKSPLISETAISDYR